LEFGEKLRNSESEDRFGIRYLLGDFSSGVEGIGGGDDGAERHDGETNNGEVD
jgi:hypothetical protein